MLDVATHNAGKVEKAESYSAQRGVDLRTVELDVRDQGSVDAAVARVIREQGRIDVLIHNAGHMAVPRRSTRSATGSAPPIWSAPAWATSCTLPGVIKPAFGRFPEGRATTRNDAARQRVHNPC